MEPVFNELLQLLEKTAVTVEFDRTRIDYMNYGQDEVDAGIEPNEEDKYYYYTVKVDGYSNLKRYSERIDILIREFEKGIENQLNDKSYYFNVKKQLEKIKSTVVPIYSNPYIISFSDQSNIRERVIGSKSEYYFEPNIYVKYINGTELDSDFGEFHVIKKFVDKKFYLARRIEAIVKSSLELLNEHRRGKNLGAFKFKDEGILIDPKLDLFRKELINNKLIEKIAPAKFAKCFSGGVVEEKVNWDDNEVSLVFFVKRLDEENLIDSNMKWVALSNSFLLKSKPIFNDKISHTTAICKAETRRKIIKCLKVLKG